MQRLPTDINCDMGEGIGNDALIMPWISSANIACGFHAGDDDTMKQTIGLALQHNVAIGAHPSFHDLQNFGRTEMQISLEALYDLICIQVHRLQTLAEKEGAHLHHVKPHGALYNMSARDAAMSSVIAKAVKDTDDRLIFYGLSGSHLVNEAKKAGLVTASEVFADRTYRDDGTLTPRSEKNALIEDADHSIKQVIQMITERKVISTSGKAVPINVETLCIHGDGRHAVAFAKLIHQTLKQHGIAIQTI